MKEIWKAIKDIEKRARKAGGSAKGDTSSKRPDRGQLKKDRSDEEGVASYIESQMDDNSDDSVTDIVDIIPSNRSLGDSESEFSEKLVESFGNNS